MLWYLFLYLDPTDGRRTHFHSVHTLLLLNNLPNLILFGTGQHDQRASIRPIPAVLAILVLEGDTLARAKSSAVSRKLFVHRDTSNVNKITHACVTAAFLGFLCCAAEEAVFVCVFTTVLLDTSVLQGTEDGIRPIVFVEIVFVLCEFGLVVLEFSLGRFELRLCIRNDLGLGRISRVRIGKDAILNERYTKVAKFRIDPVADGSWEVFFKLVDCSVLDWQYSTEI
jgi:hypothetical protein